MMSRSGTAGQHLAKGWLQATKADRRVPDTTHEGMFLLADEFKFNSGLELFAGETQECRYVCLTKD
jgi:hypothetical protein